MGRPVGDWAVSHNFLGGWTAQFKCCWRAGRRGVLSRAPAEDVNRAEGGCTASRDTADLLRDITFFLGGGAVFRMSYARQELERVARPCVYSKHKKGRPPMRSVTGEEPRARSEAGSVASSRRSLAFQAVAEAANA